MKIRTFFAGLAAALTLSTALAQPLEVRDAWVRSAVAGQSGTGAFMILKARENMRLLGASSTLAGVAELHEMTMSGNVMQMRAVPGIDLPAGRAVELKPGGFHLMLMDLKGPLLPDAVVPVTLSLRDAAGRETRLELKLPVRLQGPGAAHKH